MSSTTSRPIGGGRTQITDGKTGTILHTDVSPEFGGGGSTFSSTDLIGAGLGSCISSSLEPLAVRHGIPLDAISITVHKELGVDPKRIVRLAVDIEVATTNDPKIAKLFERAAHSCTVHRSLHPDIESPIQVLFIDRPAN
ncbi:MAG: OsmC family protein [Acidimicrobiia bacterium]|nr:OsmC family protein [Acidimicrobiia bacterium]